MASTPLSPLDSAFLFLERPTQPLHVGCVTILDGPLDFPDLTAHFRETLAELPRFRQRPIRAFMDLRAPTWEDDPNFAIPHHLHRVVLPAPGGPTELHAAIDRQFSAPLSLERPPWEVHSIEGLADGRSALVWKVHHCMVDGVSGAQLLDATTTSAGQGSGATVEDAERARRAGLRARAASTFRLADIARVVLEAVSTVSTMAVAPPSPLPFLGPLSARRRIVWSHFPLSDLLAIRGAADCKVNDVVLAIVAGALRRYLEHHGTATAEARVRALVPVSMRSEGDRLALGNLVTGAFPELPVDVRDPVERLHAIAREMTEIKRRGQPRSTGLALAASSILPMPVQALVGRYAPDQALVSTIVTNVPGPAELRTLMDRRIEAIHPMVPLALGMGLEFAVMSYNGALSIAATTDAGLVPDPERIAEALVASETELRNAILEPRDRVTPTLASLQGPRVRDLMSQDVTSVAPEDSLLDTFRLMRARSIRHLPVVNARGRLVGIITHRDLVAAASSTLESKFERARLHNLGSAEVWEAMEIHLSTVGPDESAADAGRRLVRHKIGCLPVVDAAGALLGIVTMTDYVRWAADHLEEHEHTHAAIG